jgi:hypothetical protein
MALDAFGLKWLAWLRWSDPARVSINRDRAKAHQEGMREQPRKDAMEIA